MEAIPKHLEKYIVEQNYDRYTAEDQAVWRYVMRQLKCFLSEQAHHAYLDGLEKTGITSESIPSIKTMNKCLRKFGWGAIPVSGFIPPAAFMEFQSLGYLPIASDMRTIDHILYTPAPDIVHEAAGHAPILIDKDFSTYLKNYAQIASKAIISSEDLNLYEAIRLLSDAKENPNSTPEEIQDLESNLEKIIKSMSFNSEANLLSRMNWWTAEYGLIGTIEQPKIFGAGLLSSIGESRSCLEDKVKKLPLDIDCIDYTYDITEKQPQLFVTKDFQQLNLVLEKLANQMAFRHGGILGMEKIIEAKTVNSIQLDSGLQISGKLTHYLSAKVDDLDIVTFFKFDGPTQLSYENKELTGHSKEYHVHGYSSPLGLLKGQKVCLSNMSHDQLLKLGIQNGELCNLEFDSGITVKGRLINVFNHQNKNLLFTFEDCTVMNGTEALFMPDWGNFDLALGTKVSSVFGGPADSKSFGEIESFVAQRVPEKTYSQQQNNKFEIYETLKRLRSQFSSEEFEKTFTTVKEKYMNDWLIGLETLELMFKNNFDSKKCENFQGLLIKANKGSAYKMDCLNKGFTIAHKEF